MTKLTLTDIANLDQKPSAIAAINNNNAAIVAAIENTLSRDGTLPNNMEDDLDMDSNRILNLPIPLSNAEPVRKAEFDQAVLGIIPGTPFHLTNTDESTDKDTGSITTEGGVGIEKNLNVGGNIGTSGSITFNGQLNNWVLPAVTATVVGRTTTDTLTNKHVDLTNNTLVGTTSQFNAALTDNDFATLDGTETLTNKTIAAGSNTVSGLITSNFAADVIDTDVNLTANSNTRIASQAAVKSYADSRIAANDAMIYKGVIDASSNPNYPAADAGHTYKISVAGKIGGASGVNVEVGDLILCTVDGTSAGNQATVGANWDIVQVNIDGAVVGPASSTDLTVPIFSGTSGKLLAATSKVLPSGAIVGTTDAQTLSGKTFNTSANTFTLNGASFGNATQATAALNVFVGDSGSGGTKGLVPAPASGDSAKFLQGDGTWTTIPGGGDLLSTNNLSDVASASTALSNIGGLGKTLTINDQTGTTYTFVIGDAGKVCRFANASPVTVTVPPNSSVAFPVGTIIFVSQSGAGKVTFAQGSGVTINSYGSAKSLAGQYIGGSLLKTATDTWTLFGALIA